MTIGIIVAMDKELQLLLPLLSEPRTTVIDGITFYLGDHENHSLVIMKSGIGKVNAALATAQMIRQFAPDLVINTGVAGGTGGDARILDIVVGDRVAYHDVWCGPETIDGQAAGCPQYFESAPEVSALPALQSPRIRHGLIASGDVFVSDPAVVLRIKELYPDVLAVDMESAAIAHACYKMQTPFFCLRVVSDTPGEADNIAQYDDFWEQAPRHSFEVIATLLDQL